jgi:hypothetical protein
VSKYKPNQIDHLTIEVLIFSLQKFEIGSNLDCQGINDIVEGGNWGHFEYLRIFFDLLFRLKIVH